ncbi:MAG: DUF916 domain-containing protein, partial [Candidatus Eremiobacterota bacterium]
GAGAQEAMQLSVTLVPRTEDEATLSYFRYSLAPGATQEDRVTLRNLGEEPLELAVYPADGSNTPDGGLTGPLQGEPNRHVGTWIRVSDQRVVLQPGQEKTLTLSLTVPADAAPGDHFGFVFLQAVTEPESTPVETGQASFSVRLQTRYGITLWERVPGDHKVNFTLAPPRKKVDRGKLQLLLDMRNQGDLFLKPVVGWRLLGPDGSEVLSRPDAELGYLLPGSSLLQPVPIATARPLVRGTYRLEVRMSYGAFGEPMTRETKSFEVDLP